MKVVLDLDPRDLWIIEEAAEQRGEKIHEFLIQRALQAAKPYRREPKAVTEATKKRMQQVKTLVEDGWDDGQISVLLHLTRQAVADTRRKLGLKPNSPFGQTKGNQ